MRIDFPGTPIFIQLAPADKAARRAVERRRGRGGQDPRVSLPHQAHEARPGLNVREHREGDVPGLRQELQVYQPRHVAPHQLHAPLARRAVRARPQVGLQPRLRVREAAEHQLAERGHPAEEGVDPVRVQLAVRPLPPPLGAAPRLHAPEPAPGASGLPRGAGKGTAYKVVHLLG